MPAAPAVLLYKVMAGAKQRARAVFQGIKLGSLCRAVEREKEKGEEEKRDEVCGGRYEV